MDDVAVHEYVHSVHDGATFLDRDFWATVSSEMLSLSWPVHLRLLDSSIDDLRSDFRSTCIIISGCLIISQSVFFCVCVFSLFECGWRRINDASRTREIFHGFSSSNTKAVKKVSKKHSKTTNDGLEVPGSMLENMGYMVSLFFTFESKIAFKITLY